MAPVPASSSRWAVAGSPVSGEARLVHADLAAIEDRLSLEIAQLDSVTVDDREMADARPGQRRNNPCANPAGTDNRNPRSLEQKLPRAADLRQDDVPGVTVEFVVAEAH